MTTAHKTGNPRIAHACPRLHQTVSLVLQRSARIAILAILAACFVTSCDRHKAEDHRKAASIQLDPALTRVNASVGLLEFNLRTRRDVNCFVAKVPSTSSDNEFSRNMKAEASVACNLTSQYIETTGPAFAAIRASGTLPAHSFAFGVFDVTDIDSDTYRDNIYEEVEIGLFPTIEICNTLEMATHSRGVPTRPCYEWHNLGTGPAPAAK